MDEQETDGGREKHKGTWLGEARAAYHAGPAPTATWLPLSHGRLSSKNQITLPTAATRALNWRAGDDIEVMLNGDMLVLSRRPRSPEEWLKATAGAASHVADWATDEKIDAWVRGLREEWDEERDWKNESGPS